MNLLTDIKKMLADDDEHNLKLEVDAFGVTVYLIYDPCLEFHDDCIIPIYYDAIDKMCYIPDSQLKEMFKPCDYGINFHEIQLIEKIMEYLDKNKDTLDKICDGYIFEKRDIYKEKHTEEGIQMMI